MATSTIIVPLPAPVRAFVEEQVASGVYGNPGDYVLELILADRDRHIANLEDRLLKNLDTEPLSFSHEELEAGNLVDLCRMEIQEKV